MLARVFRNPCPRPQILELAAAESVDSAGGIVDVDDSAVERVSEHSVRDRVEQRGVEVELLLALEQCGGLFQRRSGIRLDVVTDLCERLLSGGASGLHFYSMNQSSLTLEICRRLSL